MAASVKALFVPWNNANIPEGLAGVKGQANRRIITHIYIGVDLVGNNIEQIAPIVTAPEFRNFAQTVRQTCPRVQFILSIGGDPRILAEIASNEETRQLFITTVRNMVKTLKFDGFDLRWLFPVTADEMVVFGELLTELRAAFPLPLLLTAMVFYSSEYWSSLKYPILAIVDNCDWINVLGFDLYTPASSCELTGPPAPLYNPASCQLSGDTGVRAWINAGVEANKLVFGLPFYGHGWRLVNENNHEIFSPAKGAAPEISDPITYSQILPFIGTAGTVHKFDPSYVTDYCYRGTTWIGYDGEDSIKTKVRYAEKKELRGYLARWLEIDTDNWHLQVTASDAWDNA